MKKVLFVATVVKGHIDVFHIPYLKMFKEHGWEVSIAAKNNYEKKEECKIEYCDRFIDIPFERNPLNYSNYNAYKKLKEILRDEHFDIIHCHTPVGGLISRLAIIGSGLTETKVIYTAHGFHFHKNAPIKNWVMYYPVEKILSKYTDTLITLNNEDFNIAEKKFHASTVELIPGVGVDLRKFEPQTDEKKRELRKRYGYSQEQFILFYAAELNNNKNQELLIDTVKELKNKIPNIKLLLAGDGHQKDNYLLRIKEMKLEDNVSLLGYRSDIDSLLLISDLVVASSKREGLPVNLIEAMATGLPIIATQNRGHSELIEHGRTGFLLDSYGPIQMSEYILQLYNNPILMQQMKENSLRASKKYDVSNVLNKFENIYF